MYFSPNNLAFYSVNVADDCIEVDDATWNRIYDEMQAGRVLRADDSSMPYTEPPAPPSLEQLRENALTTLPAWEQADRAAGIDHAGQRWLTTPAALQDIRDVLLAGAVPGEQWVTADRQVVPMTLPGLQALWQAITARGAAIYRRRLEMEAEIEAMDAEQLAAFMPGWPA